MSVDFTSITATDVGRHFGRRRALLKISFACHAGETVGLLGPNGAGKSTLLGMMSGFLPPSSGTVTIDGVEVWRNPSMYSDIGLVPEAEAMFDTMTAEEFVLANARLHRLAEPQAAALAALEQVELLEAKDRRSGTFSKGMKQRVKMATALVHEPKVLLLDEPTVGVDPQSRVRLLELVREERRRGTCILYTTHYMEEAEDLCDELAIIDHGKLIACGTLPELRAMLGERDLLRLSGTFDAQRVAPALKTLEDLEIVALDEQNLTLALEGASQRLPALFAALTRAGAEVRETTLSRASLESLFIKLTGADLRE